MEKLLNAIIAHHMLACSEMIWVWMDITTRRLFIKFVVWIVVQQMPQREWKSLNCESLLKKELLSVVLSFEFFGERNFLWRWWRTLSWILGVEEIGRDFLLKWILLFKKFKNLVTKVKLKKLNFELKSDLKINWKKKFKN